MHRPQTGASHYHTKHTILNHIVFLYFNTVQKLEKLTYIEDFELFCKFEYIQPGIFTMITSIVSFGRFNRGFLTAKLVYILNCLFVRLFARNNMGETWVSRLVFKKDSFYLFNFLNVCLILNSFFLMNLSQLIFLFHIHILSP